MQNQKKNEYKEFNNPFYVLKISIKKVSKKYRTWLKNESFWQAETFDKE